MRYSRKNLLPYRYTFLLKVMIQYNLFLYPLLSFRPEFWLRSMYLLMVNHSILHFRLILRRSVV